MPAGLLYVTPDMRLGGAERHVATLLPALDRERFAPQLCCLREGGPLLAPVEAAGIPVTMLAAPAGRAAALRALPALVRLMRRLRPAVVMSHGTTASLLTRLAARAAGVPVAIAWKHNVGHLGHHGLTERLAERLAGRWTDRWFGVSYAQLPYLVGHLGADPERVRVIYNAVDARPEPAPRPATGPVVIAAVAVLREEKGHEDLLDAFAVVAAVRPEVRLLLIGDGPRRAALAARADAAGIRDRVTFLGARTDVEEILRGVDVVCLASFTIENFPYAILEAMAAARPVVCTAVGGLPELVEDGVTGLLVPARAPAALAGRLLELVDDPQLRARMGAAGRARALTRFAVAAQAERVQRELDEALARPLSARRRSP